MPIFLLCVKLVRSWKKEKEEKGWGRESRSKMERPIVRHCGGNYLGDVGKLDDNTGALLRSCLTEHHTLDPLRQTVEQSYWTFQLRVVLEWRSRRVALEVLKLHQQQQQQHCNIIIILSFVRRAMSASLVWCASSRSGPSRATAGPRETLSPLPPTFSWAPLGKKFWIFLLKWCMLV